MYVCPLELGTAAVYNTQQTLELLCATTDVRNILMQLCCVALHLL